MFVIASIFGCQPSFVEYYVPQEPAAPLPLSYAATGLDPEVVEAGCDAWWPEGVVCHEADDADLRITAVGGCREDEDGEVLGWHAPRGEPGRITLYLGCFERDDDVAMVVAHEVGHALGIGWHVAADCADAADGDASTPAVCGPALMNAVGTDVAAMTVADHDAFLARNAFLGVEAAR